MSEPPRHLDVASRPEWRWAPDAVFWHLYPLGSVGAAKERDHSAALEHRLLAIVPWLDCAQQLGATA